MVSTYAIGIDCRAGPRTEPSRRYEFRPPEINVRRADDAGDGAHGRRHDGGKADGQSRSRFHGDDDSAPSGCDRHGKGRTDLRRRSSFAASCSGYHCRTAAGDRANAALLARHIRGATMIAARANIVTAELDTSEPKELNQ